MSRRMDIFASIFSEMRRRLSEQEKKIRELNEANAEMLKTIAGNVSGLAGDVRGLTEAQERARHPPPPPPPPPPQTSLPPETPDRENMELVMKKVREEADNYFCNTINIKGWTQTEFSQFMDRLTAGVVLTPRKLAVLMLKCDITEQLVYDAIQIKFFRDTASLRLTYKKNITLRKNLKWVGCAAKDLREAGSNLKLSYFQMTPSRMSQERRALYALLSREKKLNKIQSFNFLVVRGKICALVQKRHSGPNAPRAFLGSRLVTLNPTGGYDDLNKIEEEERRSQNEDEATGPPDARPEFNQQVAVTDDDMALDGSEFTPMFGPGGILEE